MMRYLGIAALFSWFAVALYNLTQDSFATPNLWINFGILVGMIAFILEPPSPLGDTSLATVAEDSN